MNWNTIWPTARHELERISPRFGRLAASALALPALLILPVAIVVALLAGAHFFPGQVSARSGEVSKSVVEAPRQVQFISQVKTQAAREAAAAQVKDIFDQSRTDGQRQAVADLGKKISDIRHGNNTDAQKLSQVQDLKLGLPQPLAEFLVSGGDAEVQTIFARTADIVGQVMAGGIRIDTLDAAQRESVNRATGLQLPDPQGEIIRVLAPAELAVNFEAQATQDARSRASEAVSPVVVQINQGERILDFGQKVTPYDIEVLTAEGLVHPAVDWALLWGTFLLTCLLAALLLAFIQRFRPFVLGRPRLLGLIVLVDLTVLVIAKILIPAHHYGVYMIPMAAAPVLVATLVDPAVGILDALVVGTLVGVMADNVADLALVSTVGSALGIIAMQRMERMGELLRAGFVVAVASFTTLFAVGLLERRLPQEQLSEISLIAATAGFVGTVLAIGSFNFLGEIFGIATPTRLLELSNPSNPLLKRLMIQAPGTYNHSLMVANLAEAAAPLVGADPLLARLGGYFHDVGKTKRPQYFVENLAGGENPHRNLPPATSAAILDGHVIEGVELVEQYHFPRPIIDIVAQHQGTAVKTFFYRAALQAEPTTPLDAYRYPGPRPQTREAALVMLADGVEASCRTLPDRSSEALRAQIERIARTVVQDGQLDECELTFRDIDRIIECFHGLMVNMHHERIAYPQTPVVPPSRSGSPPSAVDEPSTASFPASISGTSRSARAKRLASPDR